MAFRAGDDRSSQWSERVSEVKSNRGGARPGSGRPYALKPDEKTLATVRSLAQIQCTHREAAAVLRVHIETFAKFVAEGAPGHDDWTQGRQEGLASLRRKQWKLADKNANMAIFLGKNLLSQKDKQEFEHSGSVEVATSDARDRLAHLASSGDEPGDEGEGT